MAKTKKSCHFPSNKGLQAGFSIYNGFDRKFPVQYDPEMRLPYYVAGRRFGEGSLVWLPIIYRDDEDFGCNIDPGETAFDSNFDVSICDNLRGAVLENKDGKVPKCFLDYYRANKLASTKKEPGFIAVCREGRVCVLCCSFYNPEYNNVDFVARIFNAELCRLENRTYWALVLAQIDDFHVLVGIRYAKGKELDWERASIAAKHDYYGDDNSGYDDAYNHAKWDEDDEEF